MVFLILCKTTTHVRCAVALSLNARVGSAIMLPPLPELTALERIIELGAGKLETRVACEVKMPSGEAYPVHVIALGNPDPKVPAVGYFGGVHGLERIGAGVVIAYLQSLVMRLQWDSTLHKQLESVRLVFMPIVNPGGMALGTRANPNGVDLMRNSPIEASDSVHFLIGGQRISAGLPWYRGPKSKAMEIENQAVCEVMQAELLSRDFSVSVDCHSGFGSRDRIWFPYAHRRAPIAHLAEMHALKSIFCSNQQPPPLHHRTPKPAVSGTRRLVGPFVYAILCSGAAHIFAAHPGNGLLVMGEEEPAPVVLSSRHFQSFD